MSYLEQLKKLKEPTLATATTDTSPSGSSVSSDKSRISAKKDTSGSSVSNYSDRISEINNHIEAAEERAAIMEYDGGLSRQEAERHAIERHLRPYYFKTSDSVNGGVYLSKCATLDEAIKALKDRFGDKLEEVHLCH